MVKAGAKVWEDSLHSAGGLQQNGFAQESLSQQEVGISILCSIVYYFISIG